MVAKGNAGRRLPRSFGLSAGRADASFSAGRGARGEGQAADCAWAAAESSRGEGLESVEKNKCF